MCVLVTRIMYLLRNVDSLSVGQSSVHWRSRSRSENGIKRVDVKAQVNRTLLPDGGDLRYFSFPKLVYIVNRKTRYFGHIVAIIQKAMFASI